MRLTILLTVCTVWPLTSQAAPDSNWVGINPGHGAMLSDLDYAAAAANETRKLGLGLTRIGIDGVGGKTVGARFNWLAQDQAIDAFRAVGVEVRGVISFRQHVAQSGDVMANWRYFVSKVADHYAGKINYYIIDNEPDLAKVPAQTAVDMTCAAYHEIKSVRPTIRIESPPTASAGARYLDDMIRLGVTRCADVLGIHNYGAQLDEGHRLGLDKPWRFMIRSGEPVIPVADSEGGNSFSWAPQGVSDPHAWAAGWYELAWLQHKRYGYDSLLLFSLRSPRGLWDVAGWADDRFVPNKPIYDVVRLSYQRHPFANGGFEEPNGVQRNWVVLFSLASADRPELARVNFASADTHSGLRALHMEAPTRVRQVAEGLTPGRPVTVSAWVKVEGTTTQLKALGFNHLAGTDEVTAAIGDTDGEWRQLSIEVTPTRTWIVVSLEAEGVGSASWDDISVDSN